jgi:hypothetical protein
MMLGSLLEYIDRIYDLELEVRIEEFLIGQETGRRLVGGATDGAVLVQQADDKELQVGVYIGEDTLSRLNELESSSRFTSEYLGLLCTVVEEVSHFAYLFWNASRGKPVTQLELEIQGEVDKFITSVLLCARRNNGRVPPALFDQLFGGFETRKGIGARDRARYQAASSFARNYCRSLLRRYLRDARMVDLFAELRQFYRLTQGGKIELIQRAVYS